MNAGEGLRRRPFRPVQICNSHERIDSLVIVAEIEMEPA
jgi:hypothetical protein